MKKRVRETRGFGSSVVGGGWSVSILYDDGDSDFRRLFGGIKLWRTGLSASAR